MTTKQRKTIFTTVTALLLSVLFVFACAQAENEKNPIPFQVSAHDEKLDVAFYCVEDTRIDTLSFEMAGKQLQTLKVRDRKSVV